MSSFLYKEKASNKSKDLYNKRLIYHNDMLAEQGSDFVPSNLINFSFAEKRLYGKVNRTFIPMIARGPGAETKGIRRSEDAMRPSYALAFVADAFEAMATQFDKARLTNSIDLTDRFLSDLTVYGAFEDPDALYMRSRKVYRDILVSRLKQVQYAGFQTFDEFLLQFMKLIEQSARKNPFTMPAFIKSTYCPINVSGLAIDIAAEDMQNDLEKIKKFRESKNWDFYLNACQSYGFMVDRDIPWRIVADIGSPQMLEYAAKYEMKTTDEILTIAYTYAHDRYFNMFKAYVLEIYDMSKQTIFKTTTCKDGSLRVHRQDPEKSSGLTDTAAISLYCKIRFIEEESRFSPWEQQQLVDDVLELTGNDFATALYAFERILNKTFDYSGSLSYIKERLPKMLDAMKSQSDYVDPIDGVQGGELFEGGP